MACADVDMDIQDEEGPLQREQRVKHTEQYYQASEMMPDFEGPLHKLLQKQPAVLGSIQMVSGLFSVLVGIVFAATQEMWESLFALFRVSYLTGVLFIFAGFVSNLLFKYPVLLTVSFTVNCGCILIAIIAAGLISADLAEWNPENNQRLWVEVMELSVMGIEVLMSAILCFWFLKEKNSKSS